MVSRSEFEKAVGSRPRPEDKIAFFGALLARATGLGGALVIVGGSAISVYTSGDHTSDDVDVVGSRGRIATVLRRWGFQLDESETRPYWTREDLGLVVDLVGRGYRGFDSGINEMDTPYGPVRLAAPEDLIVRRLALAGSEGKSQHLNEAVLVARQRGETIDYEYVEALVGHEGLQDLYREFRSRLGRSVFEDIDRG